MPPPSFPFETFVVVIGEESFTLQDVWTDSQFIAVLYRLPGAVVTETWLSPTQAQITLRVDDTPEATNAFRTFRYYVEKEADQRRLRREQQVAEAQNS